MSVAAFSKLENLLNHYDKMCDTHFTNNNQKTLELLTGLQNNINSLKEKNEQVNLKHNHTLSKVEEAENEEQEQSQCQVLDKEDLIKQQIIVQDDYDNLKEQIEEKIVENNEEINEETNENKNQEIIQEIIEGENEQQQNQILQDENKDIINDETSKIKQI